MKRYAILLLSTVIIISAFSGCSVLGDNKESTYLGVITDSYWKSETLHLRFDYPNGYEYGDIEKSITKEYNELASSSKYPSQKREFYITNTSNNGIETEHSFSVSLTVTKLQDYSSIYSVEDIAYNDMFEGFLDNRELGDQGKYTIAGNTWCGYYCYGRTDYVARFFKIERDYVICINFQDEGFSKSRHEETTTEFEKVLSNFSYC